MVNALSRHLKVNVYQDGKIYQQEYERGKVLYDLKIIGETDRTGTTITASGRTSRPARSLSRAFSKPATFDFDTLKHALPRDGVPQQGHPHHARATSAPRSRGRG